jgi:quercetin dioxygenase-like cupin family protein
MTIAETFAENLGRFDVDLGIQHHFSSGVYAKEIHIPAGCVIGSHSHRFDHLSLLASGEVVVRTESKSSRYTAPSCVAIEAGAHHEITAITDTVWYCIHATSVTDPALVDEELIGV